MCIRDRNKGDCFALEAPMDVQLDCDNRTMVQPDVIVLCDRGKRRKFGIFGAPDLLIEILSPSTRKKDLGIKFVKYENAGVREYWIIDPDQEKVLVYDFSQEIYPVIYGFQSKIPVGIFDGRRPTRERRKADAAGVPALLGPADGGTAAAAGGGRRGAALCLCLTMCSRIRVENAILINLDL